MTEAGPWCSRWPSVLGVGAPTYGLIEGGARGWTPPVILGSFAAAVTLLAGSVVVDGRSSAPMLPLRLSRQRLFTVSNGDGRGPVRADDVSADGRGHPRGEPAGRRARVGISSTTCQTGAVLGVAVLVALVRTRESAAASFEAGLGSAFVMASD